MHILRSFSLIVALATSAGVARAQAPLAIDLLVPDTRSAARPAVPLHEALATARRGKRLRLRLQGDDARIRTSIVGHGADSISYMENDTLHTVAAALVDSVWVERGHGGWVLGTLTGAPCAFWAGFIGAIMGSGETYTSSASDAGIILGGTAGGAIGGTLCGLPGYALGRHMVAWRLLWVRPDSR